MILLPQTRDLVRFSIWKCSWIFRFPCFANAFVPNRMHHFVECVCVSFFFHFLVRHTFFSVLFGFLCFSREKNIECSVSWKCTSYSDDGSTQTKLTTANRCWCDFRVTHGRNARAGMRHSAAANGTVRPHGNECDTEWTERAWTVWNAHWHRIAVQPECRPYLQRSFGVNVRANGRASESVWRMVCVVFFRRRRRQIRRLLLLLCSQL